MKVKELIEQLEKYDGNLEVISRGSAYDPCTGNEWSSNITVEVCYGPGGKEISSVCVEAE